FVLFCIISENNNRINTAVAFLATYTQNTSIRALSYFIFSEVYNTDDLAILSHSLSNFKAVNKNKSGHVLDQTM
uniref:Uncharacterized protein n=1 Tax=Ciona intestinalis TaxID=7719 RepID=H2XSQ6_CIOIN